MTPEEEEERVRRLLAGAGAEPEPLPDDVAARLDARLAALAGDSPSARRRWLPRVLVAAATLAVVGAAVGLTATGGSGGDSASMAGAARQQAEAGGSAASGAQDDSGGSAGGGSAPSAVRGLREVPELHTATLAADVRRALSRRAGAVTPAVPTPRSPAGAGAQSPGPDQAVPDAGLFSGAVPRCAFPAAGPGDRVLTVVLDGSPAMLVVHTRTDGTRVAQVYSCAEPGAGPGAPLARTLLPPTR